MSDPIPEPISTPEALEPTSTPDATRPFPTDLTEKPADWVDTYDETQIKAVNSNGNLRGPVFTFATVESINAGERTMAQVSIIGTGDKALVVLPEKEKAPAQGARLLIVGIATRARVINGKGPEKETETVLIHAAGLVPLAKSN